MTKPKFINSKAYQDERKKKLPTPPDEFCPECLSLKRKPSRDCPNHASYYVNRDDINLRRDDLAEAMVKHIANKEIKVQSSYDGKRHQRHWYKEAQKMLKKLMKEYERVCGEMYNE